MLQVDVIQVKFIFLWAFNHDNERDLHTEGVDTFNLDSIPTRAYQIAAQPRAMPARAGPAARLVTVVDGRLRIPQEWLGKVEEVEVFDLRGRYRAVRRARAGALHLEKHREWMAVEACVMVGR
jgi:hypothetical protein